MQLTQKLDQLVKLCINKKPGVYGTENEKNIIALYISVREQLSLIDSGYYNYLLKQKLQR